MRMRTRVSVLANLRSERAPAAANTRAPDQLVSSPSVSRIQNINQRKWSLSGAPVSVPGTRPEPFCPGGGWLRS